MKTKIYLFIATLAIFASCSKEDGKDPIEQDPENYGYVTTVAECVCEMDSIYAHYEIPARSVYLLKKRNIDGLLVVLREDQKKDSIGTHIAIETKDFSTIGVNFYIYPNENSHAEAVYSNLDIIPIYIKGQELGCLNYTCKYLDNNDASVSIVDDQKICVGINKLKHMNLYVNGRIEVLSSNIESIDAKPEEKDGVYRLPCKSGVETDCKNELIRKVLRELIGTSYLNDSTSVVSDLNASYKQEVVTMKISSGSKSYEVKAYGKPF